MQDPYSDLDAEGDEVVIYQPEATPAASGRVGAKMQHQQHQQQHQSPDSPHTSSPRHRLEAHSAAASVDSYSTPPQQVVETVHPQGSPRLAGEPVMRTQHSPQMFSPLAMKRMAAGESFQTPLRNGPGYDLYGLPMEIQRSGSSIYDPAQFPETSMEVAFLLRHYSEGPGYGSVVRIQLSKQH